MKQTKLPVLISVPHGGTEIPAKLRPRCLITDLDVVLDGDTWTKHLFNFQGLAVEYQVMDISRLVVDLNRDPMDRPPDNPDGVVKTRTVEGLPVWSEELTELEANDIIRTYYEPYHEQLMEKSNNPAVKFAVDCHTMLDVGPVKGSDEWETRPLFCISNRGLPNGEQGGETITAPPEFMQKLKVLLENVFAEEADEKVPLVAVNQPFQGGYITRSHGLRTDIPWVQLEINRRLYVPEAIAIDPTPQELARMKDIRDKLYEVFSLAAQEEIVFSEEEILSEEAKTIS
ncbi:N-formylglutamate amidohydrolase [Alkalicoccus daliensis]|uniref:Formiminoglutamase n=1 Tax=Alkalicoccus daliensis TaxID=745820 RepID=A0A1H0KKV4_9BACI|nr:N-formylglutamate amidohydrolase [Alkalicoccus daliensis]SDO56453.1 formiminoglutamase [Alkalicoccus daliensis]